MGVEDRLRGMIKEGLDMQRAWMAAGWLGLLVLASVGLAGCAGGGQDAASRGSEAVRAAAPQTQAATLAAVIKPNDRVLFLGDDMTQQMLYDRAMATALLALMPEAGLRFYNGGMEGATAAGALTWVDDLMQVTGPNVVFICFGLNDGYGQAPTAEMVNGYQRDLGRLIERVQKRAGVRLVIVLGPPSIQPAMQLAASSRPGRDGSDPTYKVLSRAACEEAARRLAASCDLFAATDGVNAEAGQEGVALSLGGNLPNENGHMVIAGTILSGIGVSGAQLDAVGWPPVAARKIGPIRPALVAGLKPQADPDLTDRSMVLYEGLRAFDETFFKAWRLGGKSPSLPSRESLLAAGDQVWGRVQKQAQLLAGGAGR